MFSESHLTALSRKTDFMKYKSKLRPHMFLDFLLFRDNNDEHCSLSDFVTALKLRYGIDIKKQSIDERFTPQAVDFIKQIVEEQLNEQITTKINGQSYFRSIKIKDSTRFQIPGHLKDIYPGPNGGASGAGIHIQFEYDFLSGSISDLNVTDAKRQDNTDAQETISDIQAGDLIIRDLGYFVQKAFKGIIKKSAYFISRVKPKTCFYDLKGHKIDLVRLRSQMEKSGLERTELLATTNQIDIPVRLIIERLSKEVVNQRLAKAKKEARKKGRQLTEEYKSHASLGLFITNVDEEILPIDSVIKLYRVRWQIELRFKAWKSYCKLNQVKKMNRFRFECQLYANLLYILLIWEVAFNFHQLTLQYLNKHISINKLYKTLTTYVEDLRKSLVESVESIKEYLRKMYEISRSNLLIETKKKKISVVDLSELCVDIQRFK